MRKAVIIGSTGLVGRALMELILKDSSYERVLSISRRKVEINDFKLHQEIMELDYLDTLKIDLSGYDAYCCLGSTMSKAGSKEAFRKVDYEYCLEFARMVKRSGVRHFILVSALGASKRSPFYYCE